MNSHAERLLLPFVSWSVALSRTKDCINPRGSSRGLFCPLSITYIIADPDLTL